MSLSSAQEIIAELHNEDDKSPLSTFVADHLGQVAHDLEIVGRAGEHIKNHGALIDQLRVNMRVITRELRYREDPDSAPRLGRGFVRETMAIDWDLEEGTPRCGLPENIITFRVAT